PDCASFSSGCGVFTSTTGTAPNRQFNIEWRTAYFGRSGTANFEVVFHENDQSFYDIVYGVTADSGNQESSGGRPKATGPATTFSGRTPTLTNGLKVTYNCSTACHTYITTTDTGSVVPGDTDTGNHCDDCTTAISFPFPITVYGQIFNGTNVSSNGNLQFTS